MQAWKEQIQKAKDTYHEAKMATARRLLEHRIGAQGGGLYFSSYGEDEEDNSVGGVPNVGGGGAVHGVRRGSFRGSRCVTAHVQRSVSCPYGHLAKLRIKSNF